MTVYMLDGLKPDLDNDCWIAPSADVMGRVRLRKDASVWFGAVLRGDNEWITIGACSNIQDGCVLHTDRDAPLAVGDYCTVGHSAVLHGCTVGDNSLIGMGAVLLNHCVIGSNCLIGAHTFIAEGKIIPDNSVVVGSPGRVIKHVDEHMAAEMKTSAENYVRNWKRFQVDLRRV